MARRGQATRFKLQPADPFDLIRWLARTQNDPRKAIAELVQNSIDARARTIVIERRRLKGVPALLVRDDGEGVLPALEREAALRHLGTNIGHSHKLGLSPSERHARVIAGQYGVGLLGFWSIGRRMEIRSRVGGGDVHTLMLEEDRATAQLGRAPLTIDAPLTFTELAIFDLHEAAQRQTVGRRLADYLAAELRGPLLQTGVSLEIHDQLARGLAQKRFVVTPRRYDGVRLDVPEEITVEGYPPIRVELYLSRGAEQPTIHLACAGTLVAEDIADVDAFDLARTPWRGNDVTGIIDFPGFQVPPGTRRGVVPNAAAAAFARALSSLEQALEHELARFATQLRAEADRQLVDELRKALRGLRDRMPHYDLPSVGHGADAAEPAAEGARLARTDDTDRPAPDAPGEEAAEPDSDADPQSSLFPPGPLAAISIAPATTRIAAGGERRVHARPVDASGVLLTTGVDLTWTIDGEGFMLEGMGPRPAVRAAGDVLPGSRARLTVEARQGDLCERAEADVIAIAKRDDDRAGSGVPKPELVDAPGAAWRSRMVGSSWQVNTGHEDYTALATHDGRTRVRYLVSLFAKEIVQRTYSLPGDGEILEHLVAVMAHAERNLRA
jgi:hypothetical protein